jgi:hypothetical protein
VFAEETLLIQWPIGKVAPTKFLPRNMSFRGVADLAELR